MIRVFRLSTDEVERFVRSGSPRRRSGAGMIYCPPPAPMSVGWLQTQEPRRICGRRGSRRNFGRKRFDLRDMN